MSNQELESHVVSLEIAKQLKEEGWKKETEFWWEWGQMSKKWDIVKNITCPNNGVDRFGVDYYPAPLATEILEELPVTISNYDLTIRKDEEGFYNVHYASLIMISRIGLPNALAMIYVWLKKENLL